MPKQSTQIIEITRLCVDLIDSSNLLCLCASLLQLFNDLVLLSHDGDDPGFKKTELFRDGQVKAVRRSRGTLFAEMDLF